MMEANIAVWQGVAMDSLKFRPGPPCPSTPCGRATPDISGLPLIFEVWPAYRAGNLWLSSTLLDTPRRTYIRLWMEADGRKVTMRIRPNMHELHSRSCSLGRSMASVGRSNNVITYP
jgi:hypothetical protein